MGKVRKRKLQKALNHTNKQAMRLRQLGLTDLERLSHTVKGEIIMVSHAHGITLNKKGLPR